MATTTLTGKDKGQASHFSRALHQEKHERIARNALHDLFTFHDALEVEMAKLKAMAAPGPVECELLLRMQEVNEHYLATMCELRVPGVERQQNALVRLSDALLDLMKLVHKRKEH